MFIHLKKSIVIFCNVKVIRAQWKIKLITFLVLNYLYIMLHFDPLFKKFLI